MSTTTSDLSAPLTPQEVDQLDKICAAADEGPWHWVVTGEKDWAFILGRFYSVDNPDVHPPAGEVQTEKFVNGAWIKVYDCDDVVVECYNQRGMANLQFCAHARTALPRALVTIRAQNEQVSQLRDKLRALARVCGCLEPDESGRPACAPPCLACTALRGET